MPFNSPETYTEGQALASYANIIINASKKQEIVPETFIWGIISSNDDSGQTEASFYTNNDASLYQLSNGIYVLDIDTFNQNPDDFHAQKQLIMKVYDKLSDFMKEHQYDVNEPLDWQPSSCMLTLQAHSVEQVYTQFKIFTLGFISSFED